LYKYIYLCAFWQQFIALVIVSHNARANLPEPLPKGLIRISYFIRKTVIIYLPNAACPAVALAQAGRGYGQR